MEKSIARKVYCVCNVVDPFQDNLKLSMSKIELKDFGRIYLGHSWFEIN